MKYIVVVIILAVFSLSSQAKILELKKNSGTIFIPEKSNWKLGKELFGMPFIYFAPSANGQRSNISFTDTGAELELDIKTLAKTQKTYQMGRKKWAETVGALAISYEPYEVKVNKNGHRIHRVGFNYSHEGKAYAEKSYYIECKGKLLFSKSLRLRENEAVEKDFADLLGSLDCGGV
jgi:hypothetical protein